MNEPEPPNHEQKKPSSRSISGLAWALLLFGISFLILCGIGLVADQNARGLSVPLMALIVSATLSLLGCALVIFSRWLRRPHNFRRFLFVFACLATLLALAYAEENWRGKYQWLKYRRGLEAKGEKFDIAALLPPQVPDDKNFAMTPLLKPALDLNQGPNGVVWNDTNGVARLEKISAELPMPDAGHGHLELGSLEKGTFADIDACAEFYRGNTNYPQASTSAAPAETIITALDKFAPELQELREAARARPYSRFPIHYEAQPCWGILLPHLARVKTLTALLEVRAIAELEAGRADAAFEELKAGFRFSDSIRDEPFLIDHLVRLATTAINLQAIREGLARHAWNDAQLAEFENYLKDLNLLAEYKHALIGERAFSVSGLEYLRRVRSTELERMVEDNSQGGSGLSALLFRIVPSGWFYQNMLTISRVHQELILPAVNERDHSVSISLTEREQQVARQFRAGPYTIFAKLLMPSLGNAIRRSARTQTYVDAARVGCALERYRLATGNLPETLDKLCPRFLDTLPKDVIDGKPLRYQPASNGDYLVYSIGWNQTDDGGRMAFGRKDKRDSVDLTRGDWVWEMTSKHS
jgi:hypothetical protein